MAQVPKSHRRFIGVLSLACALFWIALAIKPLYRDDWALENILVLAGVLLLMLFRRWFVFSRTSYGLIGVFFCLHVIGSHYTYAEVPYDSWFVKLTGRSLNETFGWERNHFDRLVHFLYGLLLTLPYRESMLHIARFKWVPWSYLLPLCMILATSLVYELIEWAAAIVFGGDLGMAFLGTQGDVWDSHRDSFGAMIGSVIATLVMVAVHIRIKRDASREWIDAQDSRE